MVVCGLYWCVSFICNHKTADEMRISDWSSDGCSSDLLATYFDGPFNFLVCCYYFNEKIDQRNQLFFGDDFRDYGDALIQAASGGGLSVATLEGALGSYEGDPAKYADAFLRSGDGFDEAYSLKNTSWRSEENTSELQSLMRISYAVFCLKKK